MIKETINPVLQASVLQRPSSFSFSTVTTTSSWRGPSTTCSRRSRPNFPGKHATTTGTRTSAPPSTNSEYVQKYLLNIPQLWLIILLYRRWPRVRQLPCQRMQRPPCMIIKRPRHPQSESTPWWSFGSKKEMHTTLIFYWANIWKVIHIFRRKVLNISDGIEDVGEVKWDLCLTLLFAWFVVFACICKGIKTSGKVRILSTFTSTNTSFILWFFTHKFSLLKCTRVAKDDSYWLCG